MNDAPSRREREVTPAPGATPANETSILVVAEHALVRAGLRSVLDGTPGLAVVAEAIDLASATRAAKRVRPDVILFDAPPVDAEDEQAFGGLRRAAPGSCVLCLARNAPRGGDELLCVPPDAGVAEFCTALGAVLGDRCAACRLRAQCPAPRIAVALSRRERQVAVRVARGMSSKQIGAALGIKLRTVNTYRESLARKLGASSPAVVTRYVLQHGLSSLVDEQLR
ncbi:MAG TPA: response regulator transcription factor [Gemmatimonadaceae bacterium]